MDDINKIQFGILSQEEILKMSVVEVTTNKFSSQGSVYDSRFGATHDVCCVCGLKNIDCTGHFGHINLNIDVVHPLFYKNVLITLKLVCIQCSRLLVTKDQINLWGFMGVTRDVRMALLLAKIQKIKYCKHCDVYQPKYTYSSSDFTYTATLQRKKIVKSISLSTNEIKNILSGISDEDVSLMGLDPFECHPKNFIIRSLPVLPTQARPYAHNENTICDDDLTIQYNEIFKINQMLMDKNLSEVKLKKYTILLNFRVKALMDNSNGAARHTNRRQIKGIKERLTGKNGLIRNNCSGKRVNYSGRTVIGPDVSLKIDEIALPPHICRILSYPERVSVHNKKYLEQLLLLKKVNTVQRTSGAIIHTKFCKKPIVLEYGDIVQRHLQDGDYVLINRQPTLHLGSMLAQKVKIITGKTIRMNLALTSTFNADFDGDEMNIHTASSELSRAELEILSRSVDNIIGSQSGRPILNIVQDCVLGMWLLSRRATVSDDCISFIIARIGIEPPDYEIRTGKDVVSLLFPKDFNYNQKSVVIRSGKLLEGALTKSVLASLVQHLVREYSKNIACDFINNAQYMANEYLLHYSFSIGIEDCLGGGGDAVNSTIQKCFMEASEVSKSVSQNYIKEARIGQSLSKARDVGMRIANSEMNKTNNFLSTVQSGSKGDMFNISQIMGLLGQQNFGGQRIPKHLNKGKRSLHSFPLSDDGEDFISRGFITNSFIKGLSAHEFWFHMMSGRESVTDTVMKTSQSGYIQRKMVKIMEDVKVQYDNTVRDSDNSIIQFVYGNDGICRTKQLTSVERIVERLNNTR
jgi:DNA-directed RNA polymerase beta' subunit